MNWLLFVVPKNLLSFVVGLIAHTPLPKPLGPLSVKWFVKRYNINIDEAEHGLEHYKTIGKLFTRKLKPGVRPIGRGYVHPADSQLTTAGMIHQGEMIQAKGKKYFASDFLGETEANRIFDGGQYLTYYLCPTDYHRVHFPYSGHVTRVDYLPGRLWPVNPWSVNHISQLFSINERVVVWMDTDRGKLAIVMVGATNVGKMTLGFEPKIVTNSSHLRHRQFETYNPPLEVQSGDELGTFHMGSTVILLAEKGFFPEVINSPFMKVRMGESF